MNVNIDRRTFLALATMIATASAAACTSDTDGGAQASQDVTSAAEGGPTACFSDDEGAFPYQEGTCSKIFARGTEEDYAMWTAPGEGGHGKTRAERAGCTPWSLSHPAGAAPNPCPNLGANYVYDQCHGYASHLKKTVAGEALKCLTNLPKVTDATASGNCAFDALDKSCPFHPTAESACMQLEPKFQGTEAEDCQRWLSGIRSVGRAHILNSADHGAWRSLHNAIEGVLVRP